MWVWKFLSQLRECRTGAVAVEFALWCTTLFLVISVALDFGLFFIERSKVNEALSVAAVASFKNAESIDFASLPGYVRAVANDQSILVTLSCNGEAGTCTNTHRKCACLLNSGKHAGKYVGKSCGTPCGGLATANSVAGYYLTIEATSTFQPLVIPNDLLANADLSQQSTVRVQ